MRVILAKTAGFCYGVERAVALAHETAKAHGGAMLGSVIHNANIVAELEREGMRLIASPEEAAAGETVLIRSHGESREVLEELQARGAEIISATCPNVRHIQRLVTEAEAAGRQVVIIGEHDHPEVQGIASWCRGAICSSAEAGTAAVKTSATATTVCARRRSGSFPRRRRRSPGPRRTA